MLRTIIVVFLLLAAKAGARHLRLSLKDAIERRLVTGQVTSLGGFQGYCISLKLISLIRDSLVVLVEPGRRFRADNAGSQDILVVKEETVPLRGGEKKTVQVKGYCCEASDMAPAKGAKYHVNALASPDLVALAAFLDSSGYEAGSEQSAIWAVSSRGSTGAITANNDSAQLALRRVVAGLKGEELPWYTLSTTQYIYPNGRIVVIPQQIRGSVPYAAAVTEYVTCYIFNEKGLPVGMMKSDWLPAAAAGNYELDVPVKGLPQGKYTVELRTRDASITRRSFEI
jgi:hypothetical protein